MCCAHGSHAQIPFEAPDRFASNDMDRNSILGGSMYPEVLERQQTVASVTARLGYLGASSGRPYDYACEPPSGVAWQNYEADARAVRITDVRTVESKPTLGIQGFELFTAPSAVRDFLDDDAIRRVYYAETAELARRATGAERAYVFDHLVRTREPNTPALTFGRRVQGARPSANGRVHNDYTEASGPRRMKSAVEAIGAEAVEGRFAIVNIWRPIRGPVLDAPLALCDARTVAGHDLVASDVHYATRTGEIYLMRYSSHHRWFYFSAMSPKEALVFKQYDSQRRGVARFVPHAAFDHPDTPPEAPPRESIEARCLVLY
jgi:hypothetical protein